MDRIVVDDRTRLLVLTGSGISAESGLSTFRGGGGLWDDQPVEEVATPEAFERDPIRVWRFYSERREGAARAEPNAAHRALVGIERRLGDRFLLVTQNVDGLHGRAGSERLVELHGSLWRVRCSRCGRPPEPDDRHPVEPPLPACDRCGGLMRPAIVWFGELLDDRDQRRVQRFLLEGAAAGDRLVFVAVGTSGNVWPASAYVGFAGGLGAETWLVNLEPAVNVDEFDHFVRGPAAITLPGLLDASPMRPS